MAEEKTSRLFLLATSIAYILIGVEILIMISPFALYFYSVYGPILHFFSSIPFLSWTAEFFLPHMTFPDDRAILALSYLQLLLVVGMLLFFSAAAPLYYGRFTNKGVVRMSFYSQIRHPQYLFLAVSGFGLLLYWPRFIILIMYVTMLFIYYLLARNEEWRMKLEAPESYEAYMKSTPMFLPGEPGGKIYALLLGWVKPKWLGILALYFLVLSLSVGIAMGIREYAVSRLPVVKTETMTLLPVFPRPAEDVKKLYQAILSSEEAGPFLRNTQTANLAYIFPADFFLTALVTEEDRRFSDDIIERFPEVLEWHQHKFSGGLGKFFKIFYNFFITLGSVETDYDIERFVFVTVQDNTGKLAGEKDLFSLFTRRTPVLLIDVDAHNHRVLAVIQTSGRHKWGSMPMPSF